ncbi:MAG: UDP-galactopyranose mutase [Lachnospiraceae bacterium]|nr:UDP-galactopyranose mutase [Lachnospiraceae bacterium]
MHYRYVVVGAGLAGLTVAERIASEKNEKVLVVEKRSHIGGNVYDSYNEDGILIHNYGPHIFHTNDKEVYEYLSKFTKWNDFWHRVLTQVDGNLIPMPITLETINQLYNLSLTPEEMKEFIDKLAVPMDEIKTSRDVALSKVGEEIYQKFFENYTKKQWGVDPAEIDTSVISRIPLRYNRDTRYFTDKYQGMPRHGYTKMCEAMIANPNIKILLNTDFEEIRNEITWDTLVYTGPADEYYGCKHGKLKYRSIDFVFETYDCESYQEAPVVNYPNDFDFTRITEFKKLTWQESKKTTILKEYPQAEGEPYYPFPTADCKAQYALYQAEMAQEKNVYFLGRLAEYRYYNMDAVVRSALNLYNEKLK